MEDSSLMAYNITQIEKHIGQKHILQQFIINVQHLIYKINSFQIFLLEENTEHLAFFKLFG